MALVFGTDPISASFTLADNNGNTSQMGFYLPTTLTRAEVDNALALLRGPVLAVTNASLIGANANIVYLEDAPIVAPPESEVERKLVLVFRTTNRRQRARVEIPSPIFGLEEAGTDAVSLTNPLIAALGSAFISGAFGAENGARNISGFDLISMERAYIAHRNRPNNP